MTEQKRREIRAELARRMGWKEGGFAGIWFPPAQSVKESIKATRTEPPDPFTNAEDKDALVTWIGAQGVNCRTKFIKHLARSIKIESGVLEGWSLLSAHEESSADWSDFFLLLTAPRETITLAAARALGIPEASE